MLFCIIDEMSLRPDEMASRSDLALA